MPLIYAITIEAADRGIAINCFTVSEGTDAERRIAGVLDIGLKLALEAIQKEVDNNTTTIEGKNIENFVKAGLDRVGAFDLKGALEKAGYKIPKQ